MKITFNIYHSMPVDFEGTKHVKKLFDELGLEYEVSGYLEKKLLGELPQSAILYVHGNYGAGYKNVGHVRRIADERPDLNIILVIQPDCMKEDDFAHKEDYQYAKQLLQQDFGPVNQVNLSTHLPSEFFLGKDLGADKPIEDSLRNYILKYIELRENG